jgi:O-antigen/teichoic acid export membrane protein
MTAGRRIFRNIRALGAAKVATLLAGLVTTAWTARVLGPDHFGILGFGTSMLAYAALFVNLGLSTYAIREIARDHDPARAATLAEHVITLRVLLALVIGLIYAPLILALDKPALVKTVLLVQALQLLGNALLLDFVYQATERMGVIATREIGTAFGTMAAVLLLVREPDDVVYAAAISAGSFLLNAGLMLVRFRRDFGRLRPRIDLTVWRRILAAAAPMAISVFAWAIFAHLDIVMLGFMAPQEQVGWYSASAKVLTLALTAAQIVMNAFIPQLAAAYGDVEQMRARMRDYATTMLSIGAVVAVGGVILAPAVLALLFGPAYTPATDALRLLMLSAGIVHLNMTFGNPLLVWHRQTAYMTVILVGGAVNALLNILLIPRWGIEGAALATVAAELTALAGLAWMHRKAVGQLYPGIVARAGLCAALTLGATGALIHALPAALSLQQHPLVALIAIGGLIVALHALALVATGLIRPSRLRQLIGVAA